jgi:ATP-dependent Clp protease ATP-binding subunit ClpC
VAGKRGILSSKIPSKTLILALNQAAVLMRQKSKRVMTAEMLLLAFLKLPEVEACQLLRNFSQERGFNWTDLEYEVDRLAAERLGAEREFDFVADDQQRVSLGDDVLALLDEGLTLAKSRGENWCHTGHILAMMTDISVGTFHTLNKRGVTQRAVQDALGKSSVSSGATAIDLVAQAKNGQPVPVYFREELLRELVNLLAMARDRHVVLVGPSGVGKQALVQALAQVMAQGKGPGGLKSVVQLNEPALLDNSLSALQAGLRLAQGGILFMPDIGRFFGGFRADFPDNVCKELQKALFADDVVIIGTATEASYNEKLAKAAGVVDRLRRLDVRPATVPETVEMLKALRSTFEADYGLTVVDKSLDEAARLAGRYYTEEPLPGAAIHLLHRACAMVKMSVKEGGGADQVKPDNQLDPDDVMVAASLLTGIPVTNMGADERSRYANMVDYLHQRLIGQDEAVVALSRAVKMARVGLKDPKRPIGAFLFLGPTGVGKTELAKALAEFMFGSESALIALDMSEYMDESSVNRLIGAPPGYVGFEGGGQLTDAVKKQPYSVVLFDEVEKASVKVFDVLLQVMEEGRLTSGKGELVSFSESVILMTSNIGSQFLAAPNLSEAEAQQQADAALKQHFRPEFLNRLSDIIYFHLLTEDNLRQILDLLLRKEDQLMLGRGLKLEVPDPAKKWLLAQNDHPEWGGRPLRRLIERHIREPMADFILKKDPQPGTVIKTTVKNNKLVFDAKKSKSKS